MPDNVNHPSHYNQGSIEPIDAIEDWKLNLHAGNVVKYVARYPHKNGIEDLKKAAWYLNRLIELETKNVLSKSNPGQSGPVRKAADNHRSPLSEIYSQRSPDASGPGKKLGEQSGDSVAKDDGRDRRESGSSDSVGQRTEGDAGRSGDHADTGG